MTLITAEKFAFPAEFEQFSDEHPSFLLDDKERANLYSRWHRAEVIVSARGVTTHPAGHYAVNSQERAGQAYLADPNENGSCECADFAKHAAHSPSAAPDGWCKHRLAALIYNRRTNLITTKGATTMDEARVSWTVKYLNSGFDQMLTLRGEDANEIISSAQKALNQLILDGALPHNGHGKPTTATTTPAQPTQQEPNPFCPKCGAATALISGTRKADNKPFSGFKCQTCNAWVSRPKKAS